MANQENEIDIILGDEHRGKIQVRTYHNDTGVWFTPRMLTSQGAIHLTAEEFDKLRQVQVR